MTIETFACWLTATNCHVVTIEPGLAVLIDAPPEPAPVVEYLVANGLSVAAVMLTHGHVDHTGGATEVAPQAPAYVHPDDDFLTLHPEAQLRALFGVVPPGSYAAPVNRLSLSDGDTIEPGNARFEVIHTPGHTPGHCCFLLDGEGVLFSGDQLFAGSVGRTDLPGGSTSQLATSMAEKVMVLDDSIRVLTGHGPDTTIGAERASNPFRYLWT